MWGTEGQSGVPGMQSGAPQLQFKVHGDILGYQGCDLGPSRVIWGHYG